MLLDVLADLIAVFVRHDDVGDDHVGSALFQLLEGARGVRIGDHVDVLTAKGDLDYLTHGCAVVNKSYYRCGAHLKLPSQWIRTLVDFTKRVQKELGWRSQNRAGGRTCAWYKLINSAFDAVAALDDINDCNIPNQIARFGVRDHSGVEKDDSIQLTRIYVQRSRLA